VIPLHDISQPKQLLMTHIFPSQRYEPEGADSEGDSGADSKDKTDEEDLAKL